MSSYVLIALITFLLPLSQACVTLPTKATFCPSPSNPIPAYLGIKYASATRFSPPTPFSYEASSVETFDTFGDACVQLDTVGSQGIFGSEDCLYLNIYTPKDAEPGNKLPVGVYIHGGSYINGAGDMYNATNMIEYLDGSMIIVTINYRLNVFGFLASDELRELSPISSTGNYGIQDQRLALSWVRENIDSFGGDSSQITIFGESAGAGSVSVHMTAPLSFPYFDRAIGESGSFSEWVATPFSLASDLYTNLLEKSGCASIQCLQEMNYKKLFTLSAQLVDPGTPISRFSAGYGFGPVVDGVELTSHPYLILASGDAKDAPLVIGTNSDEGSSFYPLPLNCTDNEVKLDWIADNFDPSALSDIYLNETMEYPDPANVKTSRSWWAGQRSAGDYLFSCPTRGAVLHSSNSSMYSSKIYGYHFEKVREGEYAVPHTGELYYIFMDDGLVGDDVDTAETLVTYWGNFIRYGDVNGRDGDEGELTYWPVYEVGRDEWMAIGGEDDGGVRVITNLKSTECEYIQGVQEEELKSFFS